MARVNSLKTMSLLESTLDDKESETTEELENPESTNNLLLNDLRQAVDFKWATIFMYDGDTGKLKVVAQSGEGIDFINRIHFSMGPGLSAWVAQKKRLVHLPDIHRGTRHEHHPVRSFISMPLLRGNSVLGVLNLAHVFPNAFGYKELQTLEAIKEEIVSKIFA